MNTKELMQDTMAFLPPGKILEGLSEEDAGRKLAGAPHTIGEIVAHMAFWQEWLLGRIAGDGRPMPASAALGWPGCEASSWIESRRRFLEGLERAAAVDTASDRPIEPPFEFPPMAHHTVRDVLAHLATHNAHHLGQIVLLRQCLGLWPPPGGGLNW